MDSDTINGNTINVYEGSTKVNANVSYSNKSVSIKVGNSLKKITTYTVEVLTDAKDIKDNSLSEKYTFGFKTRFGLSLSDTGQTADYTSTNGEDSDYMIKPPSYTDNGNSTVTDNVISLIWQKSDDNTTRKWTSAGTYCDNLTLGSKSDFITRFWKSVAAIVYPHDDYSVVILDI